MRRLGRRILRAAAALLLCAGIAAGAFLAGVVLSREREAVVTSDLLSQRLQYVQDLVTVEYHYTNMGRFENQREFYGVRIPFTGKSFLVSYDGVIKAGVDLGQARITVDAETKAVTVVLPESKIISHEIPEDSIQVFDESRNVFNPITIADYTAFTAEQKAAMEQRAKDNGLLSGAGERARLAVTSLLEAVPGMDSYTVNIR